MLRRVVAKFRENVQRKRAEREGAEGQGEAGENNQVCFCPHIHILKYAESFIVKLAFAPEKVFKDLKPSGIALYFTVSILFFLIRQACQSLLFIE